MTWTMDTINANRMKVVADIKAKFEERGIPYLSVSHGIKFGDPTLIVTMQVDNDTPATNLAMTTAFHEIVNEIVQADPTHPLATMPVEFRTMGKIVANASSDSNPTPGGD